jgi:hypothetical protein
MTPTATTQTCHVHPGIEMIEKSSFGSIRIHGKLFTTDILIYPDGRIAENWWRRHGHQLAFEDLERLVSTAPEVIVIGTGVYGRMQPEPGLEKALNARGITLLMAATAEAAAHFNRLRSSRKTGAGFHLTC